MEKHFLETMQVIFFKQDISVEIKGIENSIEQYQNVFTFMSSIVPKPENHTISKTYCVKNGYLRFSHVLEEGLLQLGKDLVITQSPN